MSITLYGTGPSRSFRCLWALHEAAVEHSYVPLELGSTKQDGAKSAKYLDLNSQGKVPTLTHDDFVLTESAAILGYIDRLAEHAFIPDELQARARYDELAFFILSELEQPLWTTSKHRFAIPKEHRVNEILETAKWEFDKALQTLNRLTDVNSFALGNAFTFADILLVQTLNWAEEFRFEIPAGYLAYRDRMYSRDAARQAIAEFKFADQS